MSAPPANTETADELPSNEEIARAVLDNLSQNCLQRVYACLSATIEEEENNVLGLSKTFADFHYRGRPLPSDAMARFAYLFSSHYEIETNQRIRLKLKASINQVLQDLETGIDQSIFYSGANALSGSLRFNHPTRELTVEWGRQPVIEQMASQNTTSEDTARQGQPINNTETAHGHNEFAYAYRAENPETLASDNGHVNEQYINNEAPVNTEEYNDEQLSSYTEAEVQHNDQVGQHYTNPDGHIEELLDTDQGSRIGEGPRSLETPTHQIRGTNPVAVRSTYLQGTKRLHNGDTDLTSDARKRSRPTETAAEQTPSRLASQFNNPVTNAAPLTRHSITLKQLIGSNDTALTRQIILHRGLFYVVECARHNRAFADKTDTLRAAFMHLKMSDCLAGTDILKINLSFEQTITHLGVHIVDCTLDDAIRHNRVRQLHIATAKIYRASCSYKRVKVHVTNTLINNFRLKRLEPWKKYAAFIGKRMHPIPVVVLPVHGTLSYLRRYPAAYTHSLIENRPSCVLFNESTQEFRGWAAGYGDQEEMAKSRIYPVMGCGEGSYRDCHVAGWISLENDDVTPFDAESTGRSDYRNNLEAFITSAKRDWEEQDSPDLVQPLPTVRIRIDSTVSDTDIQLDPSGSVEELTADTAAITNSPEHHLDRDTGGITGIEDIRLPPMALREDSSVSVHTTGTAVNEYQHLPAAQEPRDAARLSTTAQLANEKLHSLHGTGPWYLKEYPLPGERRPEPPMGI